MNSQSIPVLTIDGPSGSGKGTVGQLCAAQLDWHYLDSGAIYRSLAWLVIDNEIDIADEKSVLSTADNMRLQFHLRGEGLAQVEVNGTIVSEQLRTEHVAEVASLIAPMQAVRASLLALQRRYLKVPGLVADGRDMGSVVFPHAPYKVFLTASAEIRAKRRFNQLKSKGFDVNLARLIESIQARDVRDSNRDASPLKAAEDAVMLDTSDLSIEEVVARIMGQINADTRRAE